MRKLFDRIGTLAARFVFYVLMPCTLLLIWGIIGHIDAVALGIL